MHFTRRSPRAVLRDKRGISASLPEALAGTALKAVIIAAVGGALAAGIAFWAQSTVSAQTSSSFQTANAAFEKAVHESDVIIGKGTDRIGMLRDLPDAKCEVQTWQSLARDGKTALQVDVATVNGVCTPTTALHAAGSADDTKELAYGIATPVFEYSNLGDRAITFSGSGAATLAAGVKPDGVKQSDWVDARPYKVTMTLQSLDEDTAAAAKKSVSTGYTNVATVTEAADNLRYVPAPSTAPIPGPVRITSAVRSTVEGTSYAGAREGLAISFTGGVCKDIPTKVTASYTRNLPGAAPTVSKVMSAPLDGSVTTVHLSQVPNGSTGAVELAASCIEGGVSSTDAGDFTQKVPEPALTVSEGTSVNQHILRWTRVSSLPTTFQVTKTAAKGTQNAAPAPTTALTLTLNYTAGTNYSNKTDYKVKATVSDQSGTSDPASITGAWPVTPKTTVTSNVSGATWAAVVCPAGTTPQYSSRYYKQTGTSTAVSWSASSAWSTGRTLTGVTTPGYGRTVTEASTRCVSTVTGFASGASTSSPDAFYAPEAISVWGVRSSSAGTVYQGVREGIEIRHAGARCYNNSSARITLGFAPTSPAGQGALSNTRTLVPTGSTQSVHLAGLGNGASGSVTASVSCVAGKSSAASDTAAFTQTVPATTLTVTQGTSVDQHILRWTRVSSLPTTFQVTKTAAKGTQNAAPAPTTALTQTLNYTAGTNYGNKTDYTVKATVSSVSATSAPKSLTGQWPAAPTAQNITYKGTGTGADITDGVISWSFTEVCPAGTTRSSQEIQNTQWNGTTGASMKGNYTVGTWADNKTSATWNPSYALQGYPYQEAVNTLCRSNVTGFVSPVSTAQSATFYTRMNIPPAPVFDGYNFHDWVRGSKSGYFGTCWGIEPNRCTWSFPKGNAIDGGGWWHSYKMDYKYVCPAGSKLNWSAYKTTQHWNGASYWTGYFGRMDGWQMAEALNTLYVSHTEPSYTCGTRWKTSPKSPIGAGVTLKINRIWW